MKTALFYLLSLSSAFAAAVIPYRQLDTNKFDASRFPFVTFLSDETNLWRVVVSGGVTNMQLVNLAFPVVAGTNQLQVGLSAIGPYYYEFGVGGATFLMPSGRNASFTDKLSGSFVELLPNFPEVLLSEAGSGVSGQMEVASGILAFSTSGSQMRLEGGFTDGTSPFVFNTPLTHTTGNLLELANNGVPFIDFNVQGGGVIPQLNFWPVGTAFAALHSTNGFNINMDQGVNSYQWRFNGLSFGPRFIGAVIGDPSSPITTIYTDNVGWGLNGVGNATVVDSAGNGSPEGAFPASVGSVYRDTNGAPGAVLYVKEIGSYAVNTGWTALGGGGGVGSSYWTLSNSIVQLSTNGYTGYSFGNAAIQDLAQSNSFNIYGIGDTITGIAATNSFDAFLVGSSIEALTLQDSAQVFGIGSQPYLSTLISNSTHIFAYGNLSLSGDNIFDSTQITALGFFSMRDSLFRHVNDVIGIGQNAIATSYLTNVADIYGFGNYPLFGLSATNSSNIQGIGHSAGQNFVSTASGNLFFYGNESGLGGYATNSFDITAINGALRGASFTNSANIMGLLMDAGKNTAFSNSYNLLLVGTNATAPLGAHDAAYFGPNFRLALQGQTNLLGDNGTAPTYNGVPISGGSVSHLIGTSGTPGIASGAGAGTSPTVSIVGTDLAGEITITSGTLPSVSAVIATVTFANAYSSAPYAQLTPSNAGASTLGFIPYVTRTTTTLVLNSGTLGLAGATTYTYCYSVAQ